MLVLVHYFITSVNPRAMHDGIFFCLTILINKNEKQYNFIRMKNSKMYYYIITIQWIYTSQFILHPKT